MGLFDIFYTPGNYIGNILNLPIDEHGPLHALNIDMPRLVIATTIWGLGLYIILNAISGKGR